MVAYDCYFCGCTEIQSKIFKLSPSATRFSVLAVQQGDSDGRHICRRCLNRIIATPGAHLVESIDNLRYEQCAKCEGLGEILEPYSKNFAETCPRCNGLCNIFRCPTGLELLAECAEGVEDRDAKVEKRQGVLEYRKGDATRPVGEGPKFILHICNDLGLWGSGFVVAVSQRWLAPEKNYRSWGGPYQLGQIQLVRVEKELYVLNMVGQHGVSVRGSTDPPIRYDAVRKCLEQVVTMAKSQTYRGPYRAVSIHAPRFGAGRAGGNWNKIEAIINETLVAAGLKVTIYDYDE